MYCDMISSEGWLEDGELQLKEQEVGWLLGAGSQREGIRASKISLRLGLLVAISNRIWDSLCTFES